VVAALLVLTLALLAAAPADAGKRAKKKPSGIAGVVLGGTCYGPCIEPPPAEPAYTGEVTVSVNRASDGALVRSAMPTDGRFRFRLKRGLYDVSAIPPRSFPPPCPPGYVCPAESSVVVMPCEMGETKRVRVKRRRFTRVELHVRNVCVA
jgi:hypothetical protein